MKSSKHDDFNWGWEQMTTNRQRKQHQRAHILEVARTLFLQTGFKATHVSEIAAQADVSQVTLYKYFESKLNLGHQVVLDLVTQGYADFQAVVDDPHLSYREIVKRLIQGSQQVTDQMHPDFYHFIVADMQGRNGTDETMHTYQAGKHRFWNAVIQRGRQAGMIAPELSDEALMLYLDMFVHYISSPTGQAQMTTAGDDAHFQALTAQLDHLFFYGFIGEPPTDQKEGLEK